MLIDYKKTVIYVEHFISNFDIESIMLKVYKYASSISN